MGAKGCSSCKQVKPLEEFNRLARAKDGRQWNCRECNSRWHASMAILREIQKCEVVCANCHRRRTYARRRTYRSLRSTDSGA